MKKKEFAALAASLIGATIDAIFFSDYADVTREKTLTVTGVWEMKRRSNTFIGLEFDDSSESVVMRDYEAQDLAKGCVMADVTDRADLNYVERIAMHVRPKWRSEPCPKKLATKVADIEKEAKRIAEDLNKRSEICRDKMVWEEAYYHTYVVYMHDIRVEREPNTDMPCVTWNEELRWDKEGNVHSLVIREMPLCTVKDGELVRNESKILDYISSRIAECEAHNYDKHWYEFYDEDLDKYPLPGKGYYNPYG